MKINWKLAELLEKRDKTIYWLSNTTNIYRETLCPMRDNTKKSVSIKHLELICEALECTPNDLLQIEGE